MFYTLFLTYNLRVYDRVEGEDVPGLTFEAVNEANQTVSFSHGTDMKNQGFKENRTYTCTLVKNETGNDYESTGRFTVRDGLTNLIVFKQHSLTVTVKDSLGNIVKNKKVTLKLPQETKDGTTDVNGVVKFEKIRGLYDVIASVEYNKATGGTDTVNSGKIDMQSGNQSVTLTIPCETKVTVTVQGVANGSTVDEDVSNATVTVTNANNRSVTLSHQSDGTYTGAVLRTNNGVDLFTVSVSANGYQTGTATLSSNSGTAVSTTVQLALNDLVISGITNDQHMYTGTEYTVSITSGFPEDITPQIYEFEANGSFAITGSNGSWTIVPQKTGITKIHIGFAFDNAPSPCILIEEYEVILEKGASEFPEAPTFSSSDTDCTSETFTLPANLKCAQSLTIKAVYDESKQILAEQTFTNLTAGGRIIMELSNSVVQGNIAYTYTYTSDEVDYIGAPPTTESKPYYKSLSNVQFGDTTLVYNGNNQCPKIFADGEYDVTTGFIVKGVENSDWFIQSDTIEPVECFRYSFEVDGYGTGTFEARTYAVTVSGDKRQFYNGSVTQYYTITKRPLTLSVKNQDISYGSEIADGAEAVTISDGSLLSGHELNLTATPSTDQPTQNGTIKISGVSIMEGTTDMTKYYNITCENNPANLTISKIPMERITVDLPQKVTYNGAEQKPSVVVKADGKELTSGEDYTVEYKNNENVGTATVTLFSAAWETETITKTFEIERRPLTASISNAAETYDGTAKAENAVIILNDKVAVQDGIGATADISYADANVFYKDGVAAEKEVCASNITLTGEKAKNYTVNTSASTQAIISPRPVTVTAVSSSKTYGDADPSKYEYTVAEATPLVNDESLQGVLNREIGEKVGDYRILAGTLTDANNPNYAITYVNGTFSISQRELTVKVTVNDKLYDGTMDATIASASLDNLVIGDDVQLNNGTPKFLDIGSANEEQTVEIQFEKEFTISGEDAENYSIKNPKPENITAKIQNYKATKNKEYSVNSNDWNNTAFVVSAKEGYLLSLGCLTEAIWTDTLTSETVDDTGNGTLEFYVKDSMGAISSKVTEQYKIDTTPPLYDDCNITFEENTVKKTINEITFGLFFNKKIDVVITAGDALSGVANIEHILSDKVLTEEQVKAFAENDWNIYNDKFSMTAEDAKKVIVYVRVTDEAGNVTLFGSDGSIFDITNPVIKGVKNDETYYTTQVVNVSDTNLKAVTLNGRKLAVTEGKIAPITLEASADEDVIYKIEATDQAGNRTSLSITMKPLAELAGDIADDDFVLDDKEELKKAEETLKEALKEENLSKITRAEEKEIRVKLSKVQNLLQEIDEVKDVIEMLDNLPDAYLEDGETVNPYVSDRMDDEEQKLYSAVKAAYKAYNKLSAHQQSLISTGLKHNLSNLRKVLTDYRITDGDGKVWVYDTNGTLTFTANGPVCRFENALVDGKKVPAEEMKVTKGSTVVELDAGYLYRLGLGDHTFQMEYTDGETDVVEFSIVTMEVWNTMMKQSGANQTGTGAATGDSANILLWGAALAVGAAGMVGAKKRRKDEEA